MKKTLFLAFAIVFLTICNTTFAQNNKEIRKFDRPRSAPAVEAEVVDNIVMDKRALKHYSEQKIKTMPTVKKVQVNYLYQESFILDPGNKYSSVCKESVKDEFDVALYNNQRDENKRVKILIDEKCALSVILLSWEE